MSGAPPWRWFGRVPYRAMLRWQERRRERVIAGGPEVIALVEHPPVVTTGRRAVTGLEAVHAAGIEVVHTNRGGLATWHGPGQIVAYPIVDLHRRRLKIRDLVARLEWSLVQIGVRLGIPIETVPGRPGAWIAGAKVASIGLHVARGVSIHGLALNLSCDLTDFARFVPCGLLGVRMTRLADHGWSGEPASLASAVGTAIGAALTVPPARITSARSLEAHSSAGEHRPDTAGVGGSNPPAPTPFVHPSPMDFRTCRPPNKTGAQLS